MCVEGGGGLSTSFSHRTFGFIGETVNEIIPRISGLIERAIGKKVHLIFAQDWHSHNDDEFEIWGQHCVRETPGAEVIDVFAPFLKEAYVIKNILKATITNSDALSFST